MITYRILNAILWVLSIIVIPIQLISTFVLGLLVNWTFGLLLIPLSIVWNVFFWPLLGLSYVYEKVPFLRFPVAVIGVPIAIAANTLTALTPSMGEWESRVSKLLLSDIFPFTWHFYQFANGNGAVKYSRCYKNLHEIIQVVTKYNYKDKLTRDYVIGLKYKFPYV